MLKTFRGGLHVPENKNTSSCPIENLPSPKYVSIPMQQHIGAPATPLVSKGDRVKKGQLIAKAADGLSVNIHASISGVVIGAKDGVISIKAE